MKLISSLLMTFVLGVLALKYGWNGYLTAAFSASLLLTAREMRREWRRDSRLAR